MPFSIPSTLRRRSVLAASTAAVVLAIGGGTTAAFAAGTTPTAATASTSTCAPHLRLLLGTAPAGQLKADLQTLHAEKQGDRANERALIRKKALAGDYGARVERIATIAAGGSVKGHSWSIDLPAALKADLTSLRQTEPKSDARRAAAEKIAATALDGGYGTTVQQHAEAAQKRIQDRCAAKK